MQYKYRLANTGSSSERFGPCKICRRHVSEDWSATQYRKYQPSAKALLIRAERGTLQDEYFTGKDCWSGLYGHLECIVGQMKPDVYRLEILLRERVLGHMSRWVGVVEYLAATGVDLRPILGDLLDERCGGVGDS